MLSGSGGNGLKRRSNEPQLNLSTNNGNPVPSPNGTTFGTLLHRKNLRLKQQASNKGGDHEAAARKTDKPSTDDSSDVYPTTINKKTSTTGYLTRGGKTFSNTWTGNPQEAVEEATLTEVTACILPEDEPPLTHSKCRYYYRKHSDDPVSSLEETLAQEKKSFSFCEASSERSSSDSAPQISLKKRNHLKHLFIPMSPSEETCSRKLPQIRVTFADSDNQDTSSTQPRVISRHTSLDSQPDATISERSHDDDRVHDTLDSLDCISNSQTTEQQDSCAKVKENSRVLNKLRLKFLRQSQAQSMLTDKILTTTVTSNGVFCNGFEHLPNSPPECFTTDAAPTSICRGREGRDSLYFKIKKNATELNSPSGISCYGILSESLSQHATPKATSIKHFVNSVAKNKSIVARTQVFNFPLSIRDESASGSWDLVSDLNDDSFTQEGLENVAASISETSDTTNAPSKLETKLEAFAVTPVAESAPNNLPRACGSDRCLPDVSCFTKRQKCLKQKKCHNFLAPLPHDTMDFISESSDLTKIRRSSTDSIFETPKRAMQVNPRIVIDPPSESDVSDIDTLQIMDPSRRLSGSVTNEANHISRQLQNAALRDCADFNEKSDCGTMRTESSTMAHEISVSNEMEYKHALERVTLMRANVFAEQRHREHSTLLSIATIPPFTVPEICESMDPSLCTHVTTDEEEDLLFTNCSRDELARFAWYTAPETAIADAFLASPLTEDLSAQSEIKCRPQCSNKSPVAAMAFNGDFCSTAKNHRDPQVARAAEARGKPTNCRKKPTLRFDYNKIKNPLSIYLPLRGRTTEAPSESRGIELQDREPSLDISTDNACFENMVEKKVPEIRFRMLESLLSEASFGKFEVDETPVTHRQSYIQTPAFKLNAANAAEEDCFRCSDDTLLTGRLTQPSSTCGTLTTIYSDRLQQNDASCLSFDISDDVTSSSIYHPEPETKAIGSPSMREVNSSMDVVDERLQVPSQALYEFSESTYSTESMVSGRRKKDQESPSIMPQILPSMMPISLTNVTSDDAIPPTSRLGSIAAKHGRQRPPFLANKSRVRPNCRDGDMTPILGCDTSCHENNLLSGNACRSSVEVYYDLSPQRIRSWRDFRNDTTEVRVSVDLDRNASSAVGYDDLHSEYSDHESAYLQESRDLKNHHSLRKASVRDPRKSKKTKTKKKCKKVVERRRRMENEPSPQRGSNGIIYLPQMNITAFGPEQIPHFNAAEDVSTTTFKCGPQSNNLDKAQGNRSFRTSQVRQSPIEKTSAIQKFASKSVKLHIIAEQIPRRRNRSLSRGHSRQIACHAFRLQQRQTNAYDRKVRQLSLTRIANTNNNACVVRELPQKRNSLTTVSSLPGFTCGNHETSVTLSGPSSTKDSTSGKRKVVKKKAKYTQNTHPKQSVTTTTSTLRGRQRKQRSCSREFCTPTVRRNHFEDAHMVDLLLKGSSEPENPKRLNSRTRSSRIFSNQKRRNTSNSGEPMGKKPLLSRSRRSPSAGNFVQLQARKNLLKQNLRAIAGAHFPNPKSTTNLCCGDKLGSVGRNGGEVNRYYSMEPSPQLILRPPITLGSSDSSLSLIPAPILVDKTIRPTSSFSDGTKENSMSDSNTPTVTEDRLYRLRIARDTSLRLNETASASPCGRLSSTIYVREANTQPPNEQWVSTSTGCIVNEEDKPADRAFFPPFVSISVQSVNIFAQRSGFGHEGDCGVEAEVVGPPLPPPRRKQNSQMTRFCGLPSNLIGHSASRAITKNVALKTAYHLVDPTMKGARPWRILKKTQVSVAEDRYSFLVGSSGALQRSQIGPRTLMLLAVTISIGEDFMETHPVRILSNCSMDACIYRARQTDPVHKMKWAFPRSVVFSAA